MGRVGAAGIPMPARITKDVAPETSRTATVETVRDPNASRTRWGGAFLALGLALSLGSFALILTLPIPPVDAAGRAASWVANASTVKLSGWLGVFGNALIAAGALFLVTRTVATRRDIPASACWLLVAVGSLLFVGLDAFKAGALVPLAQDFAANQAPYLAAEGMRSILVGVGMMVMSLGTAFIFVGEAESQSRTIPSALAWAAAACSALVIIGAAGVMFGVPILGVFYYAGFVVSLSALFLGVKIALPSGTGEAQAFSRLTRA
jgi:hypothetical protein